MFRQNPVDNYLPRRAKNKKIPASIRKEIVIFIKIQKGKSGSILTKSLMVRLKVVKDIDGKVFA